MTPSEITSHQKGTIECRKEVQAIETKLKAMPPSRERSLALTKLQEARLWLQEDLERLTRSMAEAMLTNRA